MTIVQKISLANSYNSFVKSLVFKRKDSLTIPAGSRIVNIGTSLTDDGFQGLDESASTSGHRHRGYDTWARILTEQNFDWINKGVAGNTIQQMIDRFDADVTSQNPDVVMFDAGTNNASNTEEDLKTALANLYALADDIGAIAVPLTIPIREASVWSDAIRDKILSVNTWILATYPNAIDSNKYYLDPATNRPLTGMNNDGTHLTPLGGYSIGRAIAEAITIDGSRNVADGTALNSNPSLSGTSGLTGTGFTGDMPTGIRVFRMSGTTPTGVCSALEDGLRIVFTPSGNAGQDEIRIATNPLDTVGVDDMFYELISKIQASDWDGWQYIKLNLDQNGNSESYDLLDILDSETYPIPSDALSAKEYILRTSKLNFIGNGNELRASLDIGFDGQATGTGQIDMSLFHIQEYTIPNDINYMYGFTDLRNYIPSDAIKVYNTGTKIESIQAVGSDADLFIANNSVNYPDWDSTALGGVGGIVSDAANETIYTSMALQAGMIVCGVSETKAAATVRPKVFGFALTSATGPDVDKVLQVLESDTSIRYFRTQAQGNENFGTDYIGKRFFWALVYTDTSNAELFINGVSVGTFDPDADYAVAGRWHIGGGEITTGEVAIAFDYSPANGDPTIRELTDYMVEKYSIPL